MCFLKNNTHAFNTVLHSPEFQKMWNVNNGRKASIYFPVICDIFTLGKLHVSGRNGGKLLFLVYLWLKISYNSIEKLQVVLVPDGNMPRNCTLKSFRGKKKKKTDTACGGGSTGCLEAKWNKQDQDLSIWAESLVGLPWMFIYS